MTTPEWAAKWTACAVLYVERFKLSVIPIGWEYKKPLIKWREFQERRPAIKDLLEWPHENLGIVTGAISNLCVVDCESREDAEWFWRNRGQSPVVVQTRRGFHFYFRHPGEKVMNGQKIAGRYDVRGDGGYVLAPPSRHSAGSYAWKKPLVATDELPVFKAEWRPPSVCTDAGYEKAITDGVAYISRITAVSGSRGHNETYRAVCCLKAAGMRESEALLALQAWNRTNADPPWSDRELLHKVSSVYRKSENRNASID